MNDLKKIKCINELRDRLKKEDISEEEKSKLLDEIKSLILDEQNMDNEGGPPI